MGRVRLRNGEPLRPHRARRGFLAGVLLMAGSFLVYPAYPVLVIWPLSDRGRIEVTVVAAALSWAVFGAGLYLAGRRGMGVAPPPRQGAQAAAGAAAPRAAPVIDCRPDGPRCWIS